MFDPYTTALLVTNGEVLPADFGAIEFHNSALRLIVMHDLLSAFKAQYESVEKNFVMNCKARGVSVQGGVSH